MDQQIKAFIFKLFDDQLTVEEFEHALYNTPELENLLNEQDYLDLISIDYRKVVNLNDTNAKLVFSDHLDPFEFYQWRLHRSKQHFESTEIIDSVYAISLLLEAMPPWQETFKADLIELWESLGYFSSQFCLQFPAAHIIKMTEEQQFTQLDTSLRVLEAIFIYGNKQAQIDVTIGLLESIQNLALNQVHDDKLLQQIRKYLGPKAKQRWDDLSRFWDGQSTGNGSFAEKRVVVPDNPYRELVITLDRIIKLLEENQQTFWLEKLKKSQTIIKSSDFYGVKLLLTFYGGMGSLNDLVLSENNEEFNKLSSKAYELASYLQRDMDSK